MTNYQLIFDYRSNVKYRDSFNALSKLVFGLDFSIWFEAGCWNEDYICYSYIDCGQVIANVSVNKMSIILKGRNVQAVQLGTVMTHPDYRNLGLAAKLMEIVIAKYEKECDFIYLFANDSVLQFYPKFGFEAAEESKFTLKRSDLEPTGAYPIQKLDVEKDFALLKNFAENRVPVSTILGVKNNPHLLCFHFLLAFPKTLYYVEQMETIVIFEETDGQLHVYDVLSKNTVDLDSVLRSIVSTETVCIHLHFTPEFQNVETYTKEINTASDRLFIRPASCDFPRYFTFPMTSHS